ncbi:hypothetical protein AC249_AIPGENE17723 [Exaiptasia diaphana]|nr:hypothetical protein AC249_AIPGENE17723 [Exaiptasia diaphana]
MTENLGDKTIRDLVGMLRPATSSQEQPTSSQDCADCQRELKARTADLEKKSHDLESLESERQGLVTQVELCRAELGTAKAELESAKLEVASLRKAIHQFTDCNPGSVQKEVTIRTGGEGPAEEAYYAASKGPNISFVPFDNLIPVGCLIRTAVFTATVNPANASKFSIIKTVPDGRAVRLELKGPTSENIEAKILITVTYSSTGTRPP